MIVQLQLNKIYRVKDYNTLKDEISKYWESEIYDMEAFNARLRTISDKVIIITNYYEFHGDTFTYGSKIRAYKFKYIRGETDNMYVIYPHEVVDFCRDLIDIF